MRVIRCPNRHYYDSDKFPYCPHCAEEQGGAAAPAGYGQAPAAAGGLFGMQKATPVAGPSGYGQAPAAGPAGYGQKPVYNKPIHNTVDDEEEETVGYGRMSPVDNIRDNYAPVPAPAYDSEYNREIPAPAAPAAPEYGAPVAPAYDSVYHPEAQAPAYEAPAAPAAPEYGAPVAPAYDSVYHPEAQAPAYETPAAPAAPEYGAPVASAYEEAAAPAAPSFDNVYQQAPANQNVMSRGQETYRSIMEGENGPQGNAVLPGRDMYRDAAEYKSQPKPAGDDNETVLIEPKSKTPETNSRNRASAKKMAELLQMSTGQRYSILKKETIIGKFHSSQRCDIAIDNGAISRRHAIIYEIMDRFLIEDLESSNKTFLNGVELVPHRLTEMKDGDTLILANEEFVFSITN